MVGELFAAASFSFDTETTDLDPMKADLVGLSFSTAPGKAWYVPVGHGTGTQLPLEEVLAKLKSVLEAPQIAKSAHNANYDLSI